MGIQASRPAITPVAQKAAFSYAIVNDSKTPVKFHGEKETIGYQNLRLDIGLNGGPPRGSFVQVNEVATTVVTYKDGKFKATTTINYIEDRQKLASQTVFHDMLGGPAFAKALAPDVVTVLLRHKGTGIHPG